MNNSNDLFGMLFRLVLKNTFNSPSSGNPKDTRGENELMLALLGILAFVGVEAVKVVFRRNFGKQGLSLIKVVLSFVIFVAISIIAFKLNAPDSGINPEYGSHKSYIWVSIFYAFLGVFVLIAGLYHQSQIPNNDVPLHYKGDSYLLSSLIEEKGWKQTNVQNWAEPLLVLLLGGILAYINLLWGLPLVFCAISVWGYQIVEYLFGQNQVADTIQRRGYSNQSDDFTHVKNRF